MSTITTTQSFPIAFAEQKDDPSNTEFYVEWLQNSSEFPILSSSAAVNDNNLTGGNWELLQRKEVIDDEGQHILIPVEEDDDGDNSWSKLNSTFEKDELYSQVIEKNAAELRPKQLTVQPLWTNESKTNSNKTTTTTNEDDDDDEYEDDLGAELIDVYKSQSRRVNRLSNRRLIHDLKAVDTRVKGIYKLATYEGVQSPTVADDAVKSRGNRGRSDKENTLVLCAKYAHNIKRRTFNKYISEGKKKPSPSPNENSEFSVHSDVTVKL